MWDALRDLVPFAQFKKSEKDPWKSLIFSKVGGFKSKVQVAQRITYSENVSDIFSLITSSINTSSFA